LSNKHCWVFTDSIPYGNDEVFLKQELEISEKQYSKWVIFPLNPVGNLNPELSNFTFVTLSNEEKYIPLRNIFFKHFLLIFKLTFAEIFVNKIYFLKNIRNSFFQLLNDIKIATAFIEHYDKNYKKGTILYSYWFDRWANILSIAKLFRPELSFVSRAHAFDLYEEDNKNGIIPFRKFQLKQVSKVFTVSEHGEKYLVNKYPKYANKVTHRHLGSPDNGFSQNVLSGNELILISCGSVQPRKRILDIPPMLAMLKVPFHWFHVGDGPEFEKLKVSVSEFNLRNSITLLGRLNNEEFHQLLTTHPNAIFISISRNEGLPYTFMEAISHGTPIISTDSMGCGELVNENTGLLLPKGIDNMEIAAAIEKFYCEKSGDVEFRKNIRKYWEKNFNGLINYSSFHKSLCEDYAR